MTESEFREAEHATDLNALLAHHYPGLAGVCFELLEAIDESGARPPDSVCEQLIRLINCLNHVKDEIHALDVPVGWTGGDAAPARRRSPATRTFGIRTRVSLSPCNRCEKSQCKGAATHRSH